MGLNVRVKVQKFQRWILTDFRLSKVLNLEKSVNSIKLDFGKTCP